MLHARQAKELVVKSRSDIELLVEISKILADKGLNILALNGAVCAGDCVLRVVTDDNLRAMDALMAARYAPHEETAVIVELPHRPGMFKRVAETLAKEGIEIHHVFATAAGEDERSLLVFHSSNDAHALVKLRTIEAEELAATMVEA